MEVQVNAGQLVCAIAGQAISKERGDKTRRRVVKS